MSAPYQPWVDYPHIWKTESAYLSFVRGGIRRYLWSKNPIKLEFEKERKIDIPNPNPKTAKRFPMVKGGVCEHCGQSFKQTDMEVDHKKGEHSLRSMDDLQRFVEGIVCVRKEDLAWLCKPCHAVKTYAERMNLSLEEASAVKKAIEFEKKGVKKVVDFISKSGIIAATTKDKRRNQLIEIFKEK